jgi:hypothetical protein
VRTLTGGHSAVRSVQFGADRTMIYAIHDGAVLAWDLTGSRGAGARLAVDPQASQSLACALAGREMSPEEWRRFLPDRPYQRVCSG